MPDNLTAPPPPDPELINIHEPHELWDWAIYFSVPREKVREAVALVGPKVEDVKRHLGK